MIARAAVAAAVVIVVVVVVVAAGGAAAAVPAGAAAPQVMEVVEPACSVNPFGFDAFVDLLRVELVDQPPGCCDVRRRGAGAVRDGAGTRLELAIEPCDPAGAPVVVVTVTRAGSASSQRRAVSLADVVPAARPRALALVVAELVRFPAGAPPPPPVAGERSKAAMEAAKRSGPAAPAAVVSAPAIAAPAPAASVEHVVSGTFELRRHVAHETSLWGPRLALAGSGERWQIELDVGGALGRREHPLGAVVLKAVTAGAAVGPRLGLGWAAVDVGARGEVGWAWVSGESAAGARVITGAGSALVGAAGVRVALSAPARGWLRARVAVEAGAALRGLDGHADGATVAATTGAYLSIGAGVTLRL